MHRDDDATWTLRPLVTLVTHDGRYHADDVFSNALLTSVLEAAGRRVETVRTRNPDMHVPAEGRIVFDVGSVHSPDDDLYDHHQRGAPLRPDGSPYSAFGLLWNRYGMDYVRHHAPDLGPVDVLSVWDKVDRGLVLEIDLLDNGIATGNPMEGHISTIIEDMAPRGEQYPGIMDASFLARSDLCATVLAASVGKAVDRVRSAGVVSERLQLQGGGRIGVLSPATSWKGAVHDLGLTGLLFVVHPADDGSTWYCVCVPDAPGSFVSRKALPEAWAGLRNDDLRSVAGVPDAVFCHPKRFICGAVSKDGALDMARRALAAGDTEGVPA